MIRPRTVARGVELFAARTPTLPPATHTNSYALGEREEVGHRHGRFVVDDAALRRALQRARYR